MRHLLDLLYVFIFPIALLARRKHRSGLWARFLGQTVTPDVAAGFSLRVGLSRRLKPAATSRCLSSGVVWFHGVSVGEVHLLRGVIAQFRARHPNVQIVVSSTTEAGFAEALRCFADA